ncbi:MAG: S-methyl-5-thioribose kinase [Acidimicrobiales bacterium]|nr:S-methyl-5-thioribose kinase [Acidimicrobiales bacterium]
MSYQILNERTVSDYLESKPDLLRASGIDPTHLTVTEVSDGNLNQVFICRDDAGQSLCIKQALPYLRVAGESWPLKPERAAAEARSFAVGAELSPDSTPGYLGFDAENFVLAMQDLSDWTVWRTALMHGEIHQGAEADCGRHAARMAVGTSLFGIDPEVLKNQHAASMNGELCRITEDLVFTEPFMVHERNSFHDGVADAVAALRHNEALLAQVSMLKLDFMTRAEALIHGDLHTGSVMVRHDTGSTDKGHAKVFDGEFCFYGPIGFDLGALFGNYLAAAERAAVLDRPTEFRAWVRSLPAATWEAFESEVRLLWPTRVDDSFGDDFLDLWLDRIKADAIGYGGCKAIRRIVGFAKVADIEELPEPQHVTAANQVLTTATEWILDRENRTPAELLG